VRELTAN